MQQKSYLSMYMLVVSILAIGNSMRAESACNQVLCASVVKANKICVDEIVVKSGCNACHTIRARDFMDAQGRLNQTVVINEPGKWCLCEDVTFSPLEAGTPALQILSNDVYLDLGKYTLRQVDKTVSDTYAIQIGEGYNYNDPDHVLSNITITNGNILDFSAIGIFCYNASFDGPTAQVPFESLVFTDLNVLNCGISPSFDFGSGINLDSFADLPGVTPVAYKNIIIQNCNINRCHGSAAIQIFTYDNLIIENTQANDFVTDSNPDGIGVFGLSLYGLNLRMQKCQANGVQDTDPNYYYGKASGPANFAFSFNLLIQDCQFNDSFMETGLQVGTEFNLCENVVVQNCQFNNTRMGKGGGGLVTGCKGSNGVGFGQPPIGYKFTNCKFNGISIDPEAPLNSEFPSANFIAGYYTETVNNIILEDCQFANIRSENPNFAVYGGVISIDGQAGPAQLANGANYTFRNCVASDISSTCTFEEVFGLGLEGFDQNTDGEQTAFHNVVFENCIVERVSGTSDSERVAGINVGLRIVGPGNNRLPGQFPKLFNMFVKNCRVSDVHSTSENSNHLSAGIIAESLNHPVLLNNSVSDCDRGILFTGSELIYPDNLFQLSETFTGALAYPPVFVDLTSIPSPLPLQSFENLFEENGIALSPSDESIDLSRNYLYAPVDLNSLNWQSGSEILYDANGGEAIGGLVDGQIYYLIVYVPGYSSNGVIMNNTVDNCDLSGYQDDAPITSSAWVNNFAFNNGAPSSDETNYSISWVNDLNKPITGGSLAAYPTGSQKAYNVSLTP